MGCATNKAVVARNVNPSKQIPTSTKATSSSQGTYSQMSVVDIGDVETGDVVAVDSENLSKTATVPRPSSPRRSDAEGLLPPKDHGCVRNFQLVEHDRETPENPSGLRMQIMKASVMKHYAFCAAGLLFLQIVQLALVAVDHHIDRLSIISIPANGLAIVATIPLVFNADRFVQLRFLGPLITLTLTVAFFDFCTVSGLVARIAGGEASAASRVRLYVLSASCALAAVLCLSFWRLYKTLREQGLYPLHAGGVHTTSVHPLEIMCDAEDVVLLPDCECNTVPRQDDGVQLVPNERLQVWR